MKKFTKGLCCVLVSLLGAVCFAACGGGEEEKQPETPAEEKVLMIGDSLFDLWKPACYTDLAGAENLTNIAVGGTTSNYWVNSIKMVVAQAPTEIVISIGTNNIADLHQSGQEAAEGEKGIQELLEVLHENCPDAHLYLLTINICGESIRWENREEIRTCNRLMRAYCETLDWAEMVETETAFYNDTNYDEKPAVEYFVNDYLHFSAKGYQVLTGIVRSALGLDAE